MKLSEIIEEIAEKYPHSFSNTSVIRKINQIQNELFRTVYKSSTTAAYNLQKGVFAYTLPFPFSSLVDVVVNGSEYMYQDTKKQARSSAYYYFIGKNGLGIYPTPDKDIVGGLYLFYNRAPVQLSENELSAVPEFDTDFHMMLVYGALAQIAENYMDIAMVNNFTAKYNGMLIDFQKVDDSKPEYPIIEDVMGGLF